VERALALGELGDDAKGSESNTDFDAAREEVVRLFEREYLTALVKKHDGNLSAVAREAGMQRSRLYRVLVHAGLRSPTADDSSM
jgi:two-component system, NtrC family, nitrogen regulation response regulator NtrX